MKLAVFILLSISAHTALIVLWPNSHEAVQHLPHSDASTIYIHTAKPETQIPETRQTQVQELPVEPVREMEPDTSISEKPVQTEQTTQIRKAGDENNTHPPEASQIAIISNPAPVISRQQRNQITSYIEKELNLNFNYPSLAIRKGWEGTVLLNFSVGADGRIENIKIKQSSGYRILDKSALNNLSKVRNIDELNLELNGQRYELQLPVIYKLTGTSQHG